MDGRLPNLNGERAGPAPRSPAYRAPVFVSPLKGMPQIALGGDVPVFDLGDQGRLDPARLRLPDRLRQLRLRGIDRIQPTAEVGRDFHREAGPHLAYVAQLLALALAEVERRDAAEGGNDPTIGIARARWS